MRKFVIPGLVVAAAAGLLILLVVGVSNNADTSSIDARVARGAFPKAPEYTTELPVLGSSARMNLASLKGKVVVVNIFASWCPPCHAEAPVLAREQKLISKHGGTVLGVAWNDSPSATEQFDRQFHVRYPVVRDVSGAFARAYGTHMAPETFIINRQGDIQALQRFQVSQAWLTKTLTPILNEKS